MKLRNLIAAGLLSLFAIAAATVITTSNAHGLGKAVNADGKRGSFAFDATKVTHNADVSVKGVFDFVLPGATATDSVAVHIGSVSVMDVLDNTAGFGGDGILRVQHGADLHYYKGSVRVYATSNRHPGEAGDPDTIGIHFVPTTSTDPTFEFSGHVNDGDIAVTTIKSY